MKRLMKTGIAFLCAFALAACGLSLADGQASRTNTHRKAAAAFIQRFIYSPSFRWNRRSALPWAIFSFSSAERSNSSRKERIASFLR